MKKILLYVVLGSLFISLIMTLTQGKTIIFTLNNMLNMFSSMPKFDLSPMYDALTSLKLSQWEWVPIVGTIIKISQSILIGTVFIFDCVVQLGTFIVYLVPRLFTGTV